MFGFGRKVVNHIWLAQESMYFFDQEKNVNNCQTILNQLDNTFYHNKELGFIEFDNFVLNWIAMRFNLYICAMDDAETFDDRENFKYFVTNYLDVIIYEKLEIPPENWHYHYTSKYQSEKIIDNVRTLEKENFKGNLSNEDFNLLLDAVEASTRIFGETLKKVRVKKTHLL